MRMSKIERQEEKENYFVKWGIREGRTNQGRLDISRKQKCINLIKTSMLKSLSCQVRGCSQDDRLQNTPGKQEDFATLTGSSVATTISQAENSDVDNVIV